MCVSQEEEEDDERTLRVVKRKTRVHANSRRLCEKKYDVASALEKEEIPLKRERIAIREILRSSCNCNTSAIFFFHCRAYRQVDNERPNVRVTLHLSTRSYLAEPLLIVWTFLEPQSGTVSSPD